VNLEVNLDVNLDVNLELAFLTRTARLKLEHFARFTFGKCDPKWQDSLRAWGGSSGGGSWGLVGVGLLVGLRLLLVLLLLLLLMLAAGASATTAAAAAAAAVRCCCCCCSCCCCCCWLCCCCCCCCVGPKVNLAARPRSESRRPARARPQSGPRGPAPRQILEPGFKMNLGSCSRVALGPWCQNESRRPVAHCIWEPRLKMNLGTLPPTYPGARPRRRIPHPGLKAKPGALPQSESPSLVPNLISKSCRKPNREDQK
jgi:hypothetical protein